MRVYINRYRDHWISPYTILEKVFFWREIDYDEPIIEKWSNRLNPFCEMLQKVRDKINPKINYVKIDPWDTWSMDHTLSYIILPMLKQLKATTHGAPFVDDEDVPEGIGLRSTEAEPKEDEYDVDSNHFKRWNWALDEMIFAFECKIDDSWQEAFCSGEFDTVWIPVDREGNEVPKEDAKLFHMTDGPNHTYKCDYEGMKVVETRIQNGFRLFGRYYQNLWD
jgi:hypothetical protein